MRALGANPRQTLIRRALVPGLAVTLALAGAAVVWSGVQRLEPERYALLVAIDRDENGPSGEGVVAPHRELAALLRDRYGFKTLELYDRQARRQRVLAALADLTKLTKSSDDVLIVLALPSINVREDLLFVTDDSNIDQPWTLLSSLEIGRTLTGSSAYERPDILFILSNCSLPLESDERAGAITYCPKNATPTSALAEVGRALVAVLGGTEATAGKPLSPTFLIEILNERVPDVRFRYSGGLIAFRLSPHRSLLDETADRLTQATSEADRVAALRNLGERLGGKPVAVPSAADAQRLGQEALALANDAAQPASVRAAAISTLGYLRSAAATPSLGEILSANDTGELRKAALQALAMIGGDETVGPLRLALSHPDSAVRRDAVGLAGLRGDTAAVPALATIADADLDEGVRVTALQTLAVLDPGDHLHRVLTTVQELAHDPSPAIRQEALATLGVLGGKLSGEALLRLIRRDEDPDVRLAVAYAMPKLFRERDRETIERALVSATGEGNPQAVREAAIWALGEIGGPTAERTLHRALNEKLETVRAAAAEGLGKIKSAEAIPRLAAILREDTPTVKVAAINALGAIGDPRGFDSLFAALKDEDVYVRGAAEKALQMIKSQPQPKLFEPQLKDRSPAVRLAAIQQLSQSASPAVVPALIARLADDDFHVRQAAIQGLGRHSDAASLRAIIQALDDPNFLMRQGAAAVLGAIGSREAGQALSLHTKDPSGAVRSQVLRSLNDLGSADLQLFLAAAEDPDAAVRLVAAEALVGFAAPEARQALERLTKDEVPEVRLLATEGLRKEAGIN
jgi:HEAT repeat protein